MASNIKKKKQEEKKISIGMKTSPIYGVKSKNKFKQN